MADKTHRTPLGDAEMQALFEAGQAHVPVPPDDLIARILAEAEAQIAPPAAIRRRGWLFRALTEIGGWPAAAGMAAAAVAGVTIGIVSPEALDSLWGGYLSIGGTQADDLLPSYAVLLGEG